MEESRFRVLVVGADGARTALADDLSGSARASFELEHASWADAVCIVRRQRALDACLVDARRLPRTALELLTGLRREASELPVVAVVSATGAREDALFEAGAADCLVFEPAASASFWRAVRKAIRHARAHASLAQRNAELTTMHRLATTGLLRAERGDELRGMVDVIAESTGFPRVAIELLAPDGLSLELVATAAADPPRGAERARPADSGPSGAVLASGEARIEFGPELVFPGGGEVAVLLSVPIRSRRETLGVLTLGHVERPRERGPILSWATNLGGYLGELIARRRLEDELALSEARFRQLADNIGQVFWLTGEDRRSIVYASKACERIFGVTPAKLSESPWAPTEHVHPADMPRVIQAVNAQRRGEPTEVEYRVMQAGGLVRWLSTRAFPVPDDTGRVCRIAGITEDITQRKRAEESLLLAAEGVTGTGERFFQSLVENLATLLDLEHVQLVVPDGLRGFRVLAGFSWGEHVASGGSDPIPEPSAQVMEEGLVLYREGLGEVFPDNERLREIEAQSYLGILLVDSVGRRLGVLCAVHGRRLQEADLVERIFRVFASRCAAEIERARAEQALGERMSFERLVTQVSNRFVYLQHDEIDRGMAEALGEIGRFAAVDLAGVFVFDWERRVAVRTCAWSSGGEPEAEAPRSIDERPWFLERLRADGFVHVADPSDLPPEAAALAAELRANGSRSLTSVSMVSRGELRGYLALESAGSSRVLSPDGVVLLRLLAETLANALERKGADLEREQLAAQLRQSQKMEAIGTLAGGVAHDFNNLLTAILAEAALLKETEPRDERVLAAAAIVEAAGRRAKDLTDQLLGYARQGKTENVLVDVSEIVSGVVRLLGRTISKSIAIESELCPDRAAVLGDPGQMQQVLLNLALNARDAMPRGGTLRFETELRPEVEGDPGEARRLEIRVRDTGSGIPEGDLERIFEPFFTTKDPGKGTGMGLAMVFGIVQNHGGSIRAENVSGGGALFRIVLPVASGIAVNRAVREERAPQRGSGRVLIVDDEPIVLNVARQLLRHLGYEVLTANGGEEAVQVWRARGSEIDLVLLDLVMPRMDGRETLRELRRMDPGAKVLLTSGWGLEGSARELLEEGILGIVRKPYEIAELSILVADAVGMERNSDLVPRPAPALRAAAGLSGGSARREG